MQKLNQYFTLRIKEGKSVVSQAKFDKLAMMINGQLTKHVYNLITCFTLLVTRETSWIELTLLRSADCIFKVEK